MQGCVCGGGGGVQDRSIPIGHVGGQVDPRRPHGSCSQNSKHMRQVCYAFKLLSWVVLPCADLGCPAMCCFLTRWVTMRQAA